MLAKEVERKPERNPNQHKYMSKRKETIDSTNKESLKKVVSKRELLPSGLGI